ncbi:MAG TPA: hypothetical protein VMV94_06310 [Phycisphaerae bacterium]|nr:hypothetical protein [Phycisphaerae bacterium]
MTVAESIAPSQWTMKARRTTVFGNLLRKEFRESAGALIAGLAIYWAMPALLELLYVALDPRHEMVPGFAWVFIMLTGWLYAIVVGAHTVCRDWGKAEEHFLLAQPISPRLVISAKLVAGLTVVAVVILAGGLWDWLLMSVRTTNPSESTLAPQEFVRTGIVVVCALAVGFAMAFAAAVMSRQMLPSVLLPSLVLTIWCAAPLISGRLAFLYPPGFLKGNSASAGPDFLHVWLTPLADIAFTVTVGACIALSLGAAMLTCTRERVIRVGHKPMAWAIAITVLALFAAAMDEVGNSLPVRATCVFRNEETIAGNQAPTWEVLQAAVAADDWVFMLSRPWRAKNPDGTGLVDVGQSVLRELQLDAEGHVQSRRQVDLIALAEQTYATHRLSGEPPQEFWKGYQPTIYVEKASPANVIVAAITAGKIVRIRLAWPEAGQPEIVSIAHLPAPANPAFYPVAQLTTARFSYVLRLAPDKAQPNQQTRPTVWSDYPRSLQIVDWADESHPQVRYEILLPPGTDIDLKQGCLVLECHQFNDGQIEVVPVDDPEVLAALQAHPLYLFSPFPSPWRRVIEPFRLGALQRLGRIYPAAWAVGKNGILYVSDSLGVRAFGPPEFGIRPVIGQCWRSPLSSLLTDHLQSSWRGEYLSGSFLLHGNSTQLFDDSLLIEPGFTVYDVSDPARPRRAGFFNAFPYECVLATPHNLVLCEGSWVTILDKPAQGRRTR